MEKGTLVVSLVGERVTELPPRKTSDVGSWLCARHSDLRELVERLGLWSVELAAPEMYQLRELVVAFDIDVRSPESLHRMQSRVRSAGLKELHRMSPGEMGRVRLLATLAERPAWGHAPEFAVSDLFMFDAAGKDLIVDYLRAVRVAVCG